MTPTLSPTEHGLTEHQALTAFDRCDRCGAQGRVRVVLTSGSDLIFCGHHAREYESKLRVVGQIVVDETANLS